MSSYLRLPLRTIPNDLSNVSLPGRNRCERFLAFVRHLNDLQQQISYQRTPSLRFYSVLRVRIEEVQLKVLLHFFECQLDSSAIRST